MAKQEKQETEKIVEYLIPEGSPMREKKLVEGSSFKKNDNSECFNHRLEKYSELDRLANNMTV